MTKRSVGIIGGGFSGAAVAYHLAQRIEAQGTRIVVFEPRERLGAGLAYDTADPVHRINVPAKRMSLLPEDPAHFARWVAATDAVADDGEAELASGDIYPRRGVFGRYADAQLRPLIEAGRIAHRRSRIARVDREGDGWRLTSDRGEIDHVDLLVLAASHPAPRPPAALVSLAGHPKLVADPTADNALASIAPGDRVLVIGNGLTAADVIASLKQRGHRGPITAISRRGLRSRGHPSSPQDPFGDFLTPRYRTARALTRAVRQAIDTAAAEGRSWHGVLDAVRAQAGDLWQGLPLSERRRIVRHLRPFWDVHRFRIAPQVERVLDAALRDGSLDILAASVAAARPAADGIAVSLRPRGGAEAFQRIVDAVVVTTGPAHGGILRSQPLLAQLHADGHIDACPTGLGIFCDRQARAISVTGQPLSSLLISGPLARGTFGELMGLPQITTHAVLVADEVARLLSQRDDKELHPLRSAS